jgi:putative transposase
LIERRPSPRALTFDERETVLGLLHSERFIDQAPATVYATLLDEDVYVCSVPTMYRILRAKKEVRERRKQRVHSQYWKPELLATRPNQLWSWDITKLLGPQKWTYYYLYVIMDVFSRYVVGWMIAPRETAGLAEELIARTCRRQNIEPGQLTIHADRGSAMTSKSVAFLLADMGVTKTHSRPQVSNDNPYSEAQFKTLKYRPDFPDRFGSIQDARAFCQTFFAWYNEKHRHSGVAMMTPENVHYGRTDQIIAVRQRALTNAYSLHPERFVRKQPVHEPLPKAAWINPPAQSQGT